MRLSFLAPVVFVLPCAAFAQESEPLRTPLTPIDRSFGGLINDGYAHMTAAPNGQIFLMNNRGDAIVCHLTGDSQTEILSTCFELGE